MSTDSITVLEALHRRYHSKKWRTLKAKVTNEPRWIPPLTKEDCLLLLSHTSPVNHQRVARFRKGSVGYLPRWLSLTILPKVAHVQRELLLDDRSIGQKAANKRRFWFRSLTHLSSYQGGPWVAAKLWVKVNVPRSIDKLSLAVSMRQDCRDEVLNVPCCSCVVTPESHRLTGIVVKATHDGESVT